MKRKKEIKRKRKSSLLFRIKRAVVSAIMPGLAIAVLWNTAEKDLRLQRRLDNVYDYVIPPRSESSPDELININTANAHQLRKLKGIGKVTAQAIIDHREEHGYFSSIDELINVRGIGEKTLAAISDKITV